MITPHECERLAATIGRAQLRMPIDAEDVLLLVRVYLEANESLMHMSQMLTIEEVERLRFEKSVMADELTNYAMREALLLECLKNNGIEPPPGLEPRP